MSRTEEKLRQALSEPADPDELQRLLNFTRSITTDATAHRDTRRSRGPARRSVLTVAAAAAVVVACAGLITAVHRSGPSTRTPAAASSTTTASSAVSSVAPALPYDVRPLQQPLSFLHGAYTYTVPSPEQAAKARIDGAAAYRNYVREGYAPDAKKYSRATVQLANLTDNLNSHVDAHGKVVYTAYHDTLVWLVRFTNYPTYRLDDPKRTPIKVEVTWTVNAADGTSIMGTADSNADSPYQPTWQHK